MKLSDISIRRPVFATMMILALVVLGLFSFIAIPVELMPEVDFPFVVVQTIYPGASAESVETEVSKKIEDAVNQIDGVRHITTQSQEGYSLIFAEFELEIDGQVATQDVREKVAGIRNDLPDDIEEPLVSQYDPGAEPVLSMAISGRRPLKETTQITKDKIKTRLETIPGIGSVEVVGGFEREILVSLNPDRMEWYEVTVDDVRVAIASANLEIPGGRVEENATEYIVRTLGRLESVPEFDRIIVKNHEGNPVLLSDIAVVSDTIAEQRSLTRYNGRPAVGLNVIKKSGANIVDMARKVKATVGGMKEELPADLTIEIVDDKSVYIEDSIHEIRFNMIIGTILAVIVIFLFLLNYKPTIIAGLSIPVSIIATLTAMRFLGFTINVMTLLGLSLAVGILIDDAIVVIENIYRHISQGKSPMQAAFDGTKEIGLAVMATTFAIMVVFLPVAFMEGLVGRFFYQFGMTVAFAVLISLFVAFTLTPMMSSRWLSRESRTASLKNAGTGGGRRGAWQSLLHFLGTWNRFFDSLKPRYRRLLEASLRHRFLVIVAASLSFVAALGVGALFIGAEFVAETDQSKMMINIDVPPGSTVWQTSERCDEIEEIVREHISEVTGSLVMIGSGNNPVTRASILFLLTPMVERSLSAKQLMDSTRTLIGAIAGIRAAVGTGEHAGGSTKPVELSIRGEDRKEITRLTHRMQRIMERTPGAIDVDNTLEEGKPEIRVEVDRRAADDLGLNLAVIPQTVRDLIEGDVVTQFKEGDEEYDVRMRLGEQYKTSLVDVGRILVKSGKDVPGKDVLLVPLRDVASLSKSTSIGRYLRFDRENEARVNANVVHGAFAGSVTNLAMEEVSQVELPPGYSVQPVGTAEIMEESFKNILRALVLSVIFIYLLLASQYESFTDPVSIMVSLPLSLVGATLALSGSSFSIISLIGIVLLMGLVTKNAILLIDFVKQRRARGVSRTDAILEAGPIRLRPILMTTFATVFGMLPLALGIGPGAELRAPMARAAIGGMLSSTLLTLVVVPVVYTIVDDVTSFLSRRKRERQPQAADVELVHEGSHNPE